MPGVADSLGRGTGIAPALSNTAPLGTIGADAAPIVIPEQNTSKRRGVAIPLLVVGVFVIASAAGLLIHFMGDSASERSVARGSVGGSGNLGYSFSDTGKRIPNKGAKVEEPTTEDGASGTKGTGTKIKRQVSGTKVETNTLPADRNQGRDTGEVDLSGSSSKSGPTGPLDGDDLMQVYRKNNIAIKMCYERSLKKNPLLKVPKTWVDIQVGLDGRVTSVNIPSLAGSELGTCILGRISRWKFRETTELFSSRFPLVFDR